MTSPRDTAPASSPSAPHGGILDLTHRVKPGMRVPPPLYNAGYGVSLERIADHDSRGFEVSVYSQVIHAGTHVDAPSHFIRGGQRMEDIDVNRWTGPACVLDLRDVGANQPVTGALLEDRGRDARPGDLVFLCTGWDEDRYGTPEYWSDSPYLTRDGAEWLVERRAKAAGFDFFQELAAKGSTLKPEDYVVHHVTLGSGVLLIEHVARLSPLAGRRVYAAALPLLIEGSEGAPARVVAWTDTE